MIDQKTINREYPVPHPDNMLEEDVTRIKDSFEKIDIDVNDLYGTTTQFNQDTQSGNYWFGDSTGTASDYLINLDPPVTALTKGMFIHMKAHAKNSGPATVNVNSLGVKNVKKIDGSDLKQGDIPENGVVTLVYDGTNFQLANSAMDKEQTGVNASNIMRAFEEIQENHGGALLMEAGWSDSFSNPDEQGADETNSSGYQHDVTNKFYKGTDPGLNLNSDNNYDTESNYLQQEWTNANQITSQVTVGDGPITLDQDTASTGDHINWWRSGEIFQAQSLTPSAGVFHSFKVNLRSVGSPTHVLVGKIYAESGDQKTGSALYTSGNYNASNLTGTFQEVEFVFTGFTPDGVTKYVFSVEGDDVGDVSNYIQIEGIVTGATFAGGANSYDNTLSTRDLQMKTYFIPSSTVTISSGIWPTNCENARISFDSGTSWFDIENRVSDTQLELFQTDLTKNQKYSASADIGNGQTPSEAFDDNSTTYWNPTNSNAVPQWLKVECATETVVNKITLNWNESESYTYTFEGSNDDVSYDPLLTINAKSYTANTVTSEAVANSTAYKYYRINITGFTGTNLVLREMEMFHIPTDGTFDYIIRMSELDSGEVKLNTGVVAEGIDNDTAIIVHGDSDFSDSSTAINKGTGAAVGSNPPVINTSVKKFGVGSMQWPTGNNENHITFTNNNDFRLVPNSTDDLFTIDFWIYLTSAISGTNAICSMGVSSASYYSLQFNSATSFVLECYDILGGSPGYSNENFTISALSSGQWYHMALIKGWGGDSTKIALCIDGVANSTVNTWATDFYTPTTPGGTFYLGKGAYTNNRALKNAYLDEFRLSHSAKWTSNFTPPTTAYSAGVYSNSEYVSICDSEAQKTNTSAWSDINSGSISEALQSQNAYYWVAFDPASNFGTGTEIKIFKQTEYEIGANSTSYVPDQIDGEDRTLVDVFYSVGNNQTITQIGIKLESETPVDTTIMLLNEDSFTQYDILYSEAGFTHTGGGEVEWFTLSTPYVTPVSGTIRIGFHIGNTGTNVKYYQNDPITMPYLFGAAPTGNDVTFLNGAGQVMTSYKHQETPSIWRKIARKIGANWEYNNDATNTPAELWTTASTNNMLHAVSQAISAQAGNRMTGTDISAITDAQWEESGGWSTSVNAMVRGLTLYSNDSSQNPSVSKYSLDYDSVRSSMDLRSKTYDPDFVPAEGYIWSQVEHSDSDGPGTFYVTRNGGTEWATVPMTQQGLPLSGDIRIYRGTVDVSGQASGQDLRCRYETEIGKDQFLHSWGLQAKS